MAALDFDSGSAGGLSEGAAARARRGDDGRADRRRPVEPTFRLRFAERALILRKQPAGELLPSAHAVDREFRIQEALAGSGVPVPRMELFCDDRAVIGTLFYVMEALDGRVLRDPALPGLEPPSAPRSTIR